MLAYALYFCTMTRAELMRTLKVKPPDLKWMVNRPNHMMDDATTEIWDLMLKRVAQRMGELIAVRGVIEHKLKHIRKQRVEEKMKRGLQ